MDVELSFVMAATSVAAVLSTYYVNHNLKQGPVKASAITSLVVGVVVAVLLAKGWLVFDYLEVVAVVFIGASFAAMASKGIVESFGLIVFAGLVFGFLFTNLGTRFNGYGGGLGTKACLSVLAAVGLKRLLIGAESLRRRGRGSQAGGLRPDLGK